MVALMRIDRANAIRFLSIDAVQKANSGHPGMPMGMADIAEVLWHDILQHNPNNPNWVNRDRFIVSNGHGAMLLYALLHLTGYNLSIDDLKQFRQLHSKTPGHPEYGHTEGVETTTGPLGQGLANAVGMAIAEKHLAATFNRPDFSIIDHYTYCFVGDGCLMEGISHEAASLAGTLGLNKLIVFYDDNRISIDGDVSEWFNDDTALRFQAYRWHVISHVDGHNSESILAAILQAKQMTDKPTLIICKTTIGYGSPNLAGSEATHGAPLGEQEVNATRTHLNWPHSPFVIPNDIYESWNAKTKGDEIERDWQQLCADYRQKWPELAKELFRRIDGLQPSNWKEQTHSFIQQLNSKKESIATRKASQQCLDYFANFLPELFGGSADLTESNCTNWKGMTAFNNQHPQGRYLHYGVREFGMSAIMNGLALHKGVLPFGGTFLTFSDYARNAIRLAAIMQQRVIFVYTHDSIGLGEDGPTHQPIEQLPSLRAIPRFSTWRPCDTVETAVAWRAALEHQGPTGLLLSRQALPFQERNEEQIQSIEKGGYILLDHASDNQPDAILIATGSEVNLAILTANQLKQENIFVRVVSMPSIDVFLSQDASYQSHVLPRALHARIAIEAAATQSWHNLVGIHGRIIGIDQFGASAPAKDVFAHFGFSTTHIAATVKEVIHAQADNHPHFQAKKCLSG
jgi:transketolase